MRRFAVLVLSLALLGNLRSALAAEKIPLDYKAYDGWNAIRGTVLSDDGRYAAYALVPQDGDPELVIHDFKTGIDIKEARGLNPVFSADARFVAYALRAPNADIHKAERAHKKPEELPKNGLAILTLATGNVMSIQRVKSFKLPPDAGSDTLAYSLEAPAPAPALAVTPAPKSAGPSPRPAASPTASPDDLHKEEDGTPLVVRDLVAATEATYAHVADYALAHDGAYVAFATQTKDGTADGLHVRAAGAAVVTDLMRTRGHYKNTTFAPKSNVFAFASDTGTYGSLAPHYELYTLDPARAPATVERVVLDVTAAGVPAGWAASDNAALRFTKDGARLFFGTAPAPTPVPSGQPESVKVDIWNWHDGDLQSYQRKQAPSESKRSYAAVARADGTHVVQLANLELPDVATNENATFALGEDSRPYRKLVSWSDDFADIYAVSLVDGTRRLLYPKSRHQSLQSPAGTPDVDDVQFAPTGRYAVVYDRDARTWISIRTSDGHRTDLGSKLGVHFYDELYDQPSPPPPYGFGGWIDGDRFALLQDRYDVWAVDPGTGIARSLTGGVGRRERVRFNPVQLDPQAESFALERPIVLHALQDDTKDQGIWRVAATGPGAFVPRRLATLPKALTLVAKARMADRIVAGEQSFATSRDLWSAPSIDAPLAQLSDSNPQRSTYRFGTERLVSYRSTWGAPLRGILYTPEGFDQHRKYPMLVYFYERFSDDFHAMPFTLPAPATSPNLLRYVSNGYVVFVPDVAYRIGHPGASALESIGPAIDSVVKRGFVDTRRIGIAGHSWAAYQIAYMITQTGRFRAVEAGAAVANMTSAYGGIRLESGLVREFQYEATQSRIGATPWDRLDLYVENSPLFHVRSVNTPYLTIANDLDDAVPWQQGIEYFTALRRLGKEAYMFSFDGEAHNLHGREQLKYWTIHLDEYFDHFLKDAPTPDWMSRGVDFLHRGQRNVDALYGEP